MCRPAVKRRGLDELRLERGLSRERLAADLGASTLSVKSWERRHVRPNDRNLLKLTQFFGVDEHDLDLAPYRQPGRPVTSKAVTQGTKAN